MPPKLVKAQAKRSPSNAAGATRQPQERTATGRPDSLARARANSPANSLARASSPARTAATSSSARASSPARTAVTNGSAAQLRGSDDMEQLRAEYKKYDQNSDGKLSFPELKVLFQKLNPSLVERDLKILFENVDRNSNGYIDFDEFVDFLGGRICSANESGGAKLEGVPWSEVVPVPLKYSERGSTIGEAELRGISLEQINELSRFLQMCLTRANIRDKNDLRVHWNNVNLYHIDFHVVKPLTLPYRCSFVELVATVPQPPVWFCSHYWGTPFQQTSALINFHAEQRELAPESSYWICTFANNQHDLSDLAGSLPDTPFVKAITSKHCQGTLTLLDYEATTFQRVWCVLENYVSSTWSKERGFKEHHLIDLAAWLPEGSGHWGGKPIPAKPTLRMDLGNLKMAEKVFAESETGGAFPQTVANRGVQIDLAEAQASRPEDRRNILHLIAATPEEEWASTDPPTECEAYEVLNRNAHRMFAVGAMYDAATRGDLRLLENLTERFPDQVNDSISDGCTPLYAAAWKNRAEAVRFLLSKEADPNRRKNEGASAIFIATQGGHQEVMFELLSASADANLCREDGFGPIHMAVQQKDKKSLQALLESKADVAVATAKGATPLILAAQLQDGDSVQALLAAKADANQKSAQGNTPYQMAKSQLVIKLLLNAKADPGSVSVAGQDIAGLTLPSLGGAKAKAKGRAKPQAEPFAHNFGAAGGLPNLSGGIISNYQMMENL